MISTNVDAPIPSFYQRPNSSCIKFFGLLTHPLRVERRCHLQSVYLQDVISVDQTDEKSGCATASNLQPRLSRNQTYHLFGPLKQHLGGKHFADDDDVQLEFLLWMSQQPKEFYAAEIGALIKRRDKCINIGGDYVKK
ncbi:hypothetical protein AVEN_151840-1 [Araneus ventricosus]|uniref:Uncharacterized protein n=1 Tax=Araneus ventricosus TaxID=182803 RepID=A0A4Y2N9Q9_ARAVE|nr:hypothetical protein AVEN_151840-1 [Araneus ventricosus]